MQLQSQVILIFILNWGKPLHLMSRVSNWGIHYLLTLLQDILGFQMNGLLNHLEQKNVATNYNVKIGVEQMESD